MARKKSKESSDLNVEDALSDIFKNDSSVYTLGELDAPVHVSDWISTGSSILDLAISNRPNGGIPVGRITEISGLEQSGKSLVSAHILAETQRRGGIAVLIDTEMAASSEFFKAIGVDLNKLHIKSADTVEELFDFIETIIEKVRSNPSLSDKLVTIVVDSIAAASSQRELDSYYGVDGYATAKAIVIGKALRKLTRPLARHRIALVFTNQLRMKMNAPAFTDPYDTPGGKGLPFFSSVRIRLSKRGKIKDKKTKKQYGLNVQAVIYKNRLGPPEQSCEFEILFDRGINDYGSWLKVLKDNKLVKIKGSYSVYTLVDKKTGEVKEEWQFQSAEFVERLSNDEEMKSAMYSDICEALIMDYVDRDSAELNDDFFLDDGSDDDIVADKDGDDD